MLGMAQTTPAQFAKTHKPRYLNLLIQFTVSGIL
jgi:hypothetical protein